MSLEPEAIKELIKTHFKELGLGEENPHINTLAREISKIASDPRLDLNQEQREKFAALLAKLEACDWLQLKILKEIEAIDAKLVQPCSAIAIRAALYLMTPATMSRILRFILRHQNRSVEELISHLRRNDSGSDELIGYV